MNANRNKAVCRKQPTVEADAIASVKLQDLKTNDDNRRIYLPGVWVRMTY